MVSATSLSIFKTGDLKWLSSPTYRLPWGCFESVYLLLPNEPYFISLYALGLLVENWTLEDYNVVTLEILLSRFLKMGSSRWFVFFFHSL